MRIRSGISILAFTCLAVVACSDSGSSEDVPRVLLPCDDPAPLSGLASPESLGYIVSLQDGVDQAAEANRLASACGFEAYEASSFGDRFTAVLNIVEIGCVRCDPVVVQVSPNAILYPLFRGQAGG